MKIPSVKISKDTLLSAIATFIIIVSLAYDLYQYWTLRDQNIRLKDNIDKLEETLWLYQSNLTKIKSEKATITDALHTEQANNDFFEGQIQNMVSTVQVLEKLSKTDSELLKKYSKIYFLNENYIPQKLTLIDPKYLNIKEKPLEIHTDVWPKLQRLLDAAIANNTQIQIVSAYRSFGTQSSLKSTYKVTYGSGTANTFSADQGYSEHQLGTAIDFTTETIGGAFAGFDKTNAYKWLTENAYKYGFVLSYPKSNTYYIFEPWHWRFVGITLATKLHDDQKYFYDLDQREIDQYLISLFD